jgi:hypothetical protein
MIADFGKMRASVRMYSRIDAAFEAVKRVRSWNQQVLAGVVCEFLIGYTDGFIMLR